MKSDNLTRGKRQYQRHVELAAAKAVRNAKWNNIDITKTVPIQAESWQVDEKDIYELIR